ncbi:putative ATP synthase subunit f, mitochondrial [Frankliniella occidentalis]|uniref:ATP synthase subunit f, mitochondrial n=1 Tax=Frankliniella occidentalis TaxID=133901 RepID=A0A9C6X6F7_FRAOC|nr:putative ATP synthase subunit f, mitochondrial [Frankliniella occidentalis]
MGWEAPNWRIGDYPSHYNQKVHGPYDPARFYGKPDTALSQVKLGELSGWLMRRNFHPRAIVQAGSRGIWRWRQKYVLPIRGNACWVYQAMAGISLFMYVLNYKRYWDHANYKYH